jgi:signal transduction histidine kinase
VVQEIYRRADQPPVVLRVGISLDYLNRELERIDDLTLIATLIAILVAPLGGYWLAGRTTRILGRIIHTTARLRPRKLEERLTVRGTGDELDQLARTINGFLDRIAAYLVQKQDFLANAAHELRSPLAAIRGSIEVALAGNRTSEEYAETLHDLIDQCASLEVLINQLLLLAETEAEQIKIQGEVAVLDDIVARSVDMFRGVAEFHEIELETSEFPRVVIEGNSSHLRQVLNNLLDNALKFTGPGGVVRVELEKDDARGEAILRVSDTGAGIPPEDLPIVFDRFYLGDKARQRIGKARGTGLGLSICEAIVQGHGGRIAVESELDHGSTFTVTLPLLQDAPAEPLSEAAT